LHVIKLVGAKYASTTKETLVVAIFATTKKNKATVKEFLIVQIDGKYQKNEGRNIGNVNH